MTRAMLTACVTRLLTGYGYVPDPAVVAVYVDGLRGYGDAVLDDLWQRAPMLWAERPTLPMMIQYAEARKQAGVGRPVEPVPDRPALPPVRLSDDHPYERLARYWEQHPPREGEVDDAVRDLLRRVGLDTASVD